MCYMYVCVCKRLCASACKCVRASGIDTYNVQWFNTGGRNSIGAFEGSHVGVLSGARQWITFYCHTVWVFQRLLRRDHRGTSLSWHVVWVLGVLRRESSPRRCAAGLRQTTSRASSDRERRDSHLIYKTFLFPQIFHPWAQSRTDRHWKSWVIIHVCNAAFNANVWMSRTCYHETCNI